MDTVRPARRSDLAELARLRVAIDAEGGIEVPPNFVEKFLRWSESNFERFTVFVAALDGRLIGNLWLERVERVPRPSHDDGPMGYVTNFFVELEHRNRGVGEGLLGAVIAYAEAAGLSLLIASPSERSEPLWRRAGFGTTDFLELALPRQGVS